jgi:hypothetical protein
MPWPCDGQVLPPLNQSFNGACSTRNCVSTEWVDYMVSSWPRDYLPKAPPVDLTVDARRQPLLRWYALTGQPEPQSLGRVPNAVASSRLKGAWEEVVRPWGANNELAIPTKMGRGGHQAYVISRPDRDFNEEELALARLLQPILRGLALHLESAASIDDGPAVHCTRFDRSRNDYPDFPEQGADRGQLGQAAKHLAAHGRKALGAHLAQIGCSRPHDGCPKGIRSGSVENDSWQFRIQSAHTRP